MNKEIVIIQAAVLDKVELTLYTVEGKKITIPQGDPRVRKIIEIAVPALASNPTVEIDIGTLEENHYAQFEEQSSGVVRFFKVAKAKLKDLFGSKPAPQVDDDGLLSPQTIGVLPGPATVHVANAGVYEVSELDEAETAAEQAERKGLPTASSTPAMLAVKPPAAERSTMDVMNGIMEHAVPVSDPNFHERGVHKQGNITDNDGTTNKVPTQSDAPDTIIAVVGNKIIPGVELIKTQFARAVKWGSTTGVENFLRRLTAVIDQRQHSVDDLLKFMERGDLPIADDGSILIYKVLKRKGDRTDGKYMDCHSKKVEQFTGAYVCMDPSLVDPNRRNECSNGLHVARRGYIHSFSGDVCVLAKLAPEDVIAVPEYDANKMRVCGYHILMELSDVQYALLKRNRPITDDEEGKRLLANAMAGKHIRRTHEVRITEQMGGGVQTRKLDVEESPKPAPTPDAPHKAEALASPSEEQKEAAIDPVAVVNTVEAETKQVQLSRKEQALELYNAWVLVLATDKEAEAKQALLAFKKAAKIGWDKLAITDPEITGEGKPVIGKVDRKKEPNRKSIRKAERKAAVKSKTQPKPKEKVMDGIDQDVTAEQRSNEHPADRSQVAKVVGATHGEGSPRERIQKLLAIGLTSAGVAGSIFKIKQQSKKSWELLGVTPEQVEQIMKLKAG